MTKILFLIIGLVLSLSVVSCGNNLNKLEQTCSGEACSEKDINKPVEEPISNEPSITSPDHGRSQQQTEPNPVDQNQNGRDQNQAEVIIDPNNEVPSEALEQALDFYNKHSNMILNKNYITIVDYSKHSSNKRFFLIDMKSGEVIKYNVAHGKGSDADNDGFAESFSNVPESKQTSLGFFLTAETYNGSNGYSMKLDGLDPTNNLARDRFIVVHGADYVQEKQNYAGRSWGCPALDKGISSLVINKIKNGSLFFAYYDASKLPPKKSK